MKTINGLIKKQRNPFHQIWDQRRRFASQASATQVPHELESILVMSGMNQSEAEKMIQELQSKDPNFQAIRVIYKDTMHEILPFLNRFTHVIQDDIESDLKSVRVSHQAISQLQLPALDSEQQSVYDEIKLAIQKGVSIHLVSGSGGTGKTTLLKHMIHQDVRNGERVGCFSGSTDGAKSFNASQNEYVMRNRTAITKEIIKDLTVIYYDEAGRGFEAKNGKLAMLLDWAEGKFDDPSDLLSGNRIKRKLIFIGDQNQRVGRPMNECQKQELMTRFSNLNAQTHELTHVKRSYPKSEMDDFLKQGINPNRSHWFTVHDDVAAFEEKMKHHKQQNASTVLTSTYAFAFDIQNKNRNRTPDIQIASQTGSHFQRNFNTITAEPWLMNEIAQAELQEVGSMFTMIGQEADHVGVIWGPGLVWRTDHWEVNKDFIKHDSLQSCNQEQIMAYAMNEIHVLLTRQLKTLDVYVMDQETRDYLSN